jgi:membrane protein
MWDRVRLPVEDWLFDRRADNGAVGRAQRFFRYPYALLRDLLGGQLNLHAMGLVYATLLAIIPLLAFSFAILRGFGLHRELEPFIQEFFRPMGEAAGPLTLRVMNFAENVRAGVVGSVGFALLIWTLLGTFKKVEDSLNFVWHVDVSRSFARRIAEYVGLLVIGPLLLGAVVGLSQMAVRYTGMSIVNLMVLSIAPYAIASALFGMVYALVPNTRVHWWAALAGGLAAGLAWDATGRLFTSFVVYSTRLAIVYAGLAIVIATLIWTYVGWLILLLGAQLSFYVQNPGYLRVGLKEPRLSSAEGEQLTLSIMYLAGQSHLHGTPPWTVNALAGRLRVPGVLVSRAIADLEAAALLVSTEHEGLIPGRDLSKIYLVDVLNVARAHSLTPGGAELSAPAAVSVVCTEVEDSWQRQLGERTLRDLVAAGPPIPSESPAIQAPAMVRSSISSEPQRTAP